ncbi:MAG: helix-turn-helix domain-containing protein [Proteobacteria bacterium]|nr:helix-turn-helix domain-containing protein [Pseudomonadota bacterium]
MAPSMESTEIESGALIGQYQQLELPSGFVRVERQSRLVLRRQHVPVECCTLSAICEVSLPEGGGGPDLLFKGAIAYVPGRRDHEILLPASEIFSCRLSQSAFLREADTLGHLVPGCWREPLLFVGVAPGDLNAVANTLLCLQHLSALSSSVALDHDRLASLMMARLVGLLFAPARRPEQMLRIDAYCLAQRARAMVRNTAIPLTVIDLCSALGVSRSILQRCFLQAFGIPPRLYFRTLRFNEVRRALQAPNAEDVSVTSTAMRWGFFHLARFAHDYYTQFGELPSKTFKGARPRRTHPRSLRRQR